MSTARSVELMNGAEIEIRPVEPADKHSSSRPGCLGQRRQLFASCAERSDSP